MGDNEFAVRTIETQSTELETSYPATIRGMWRYVRRYQAS